MRFPTLNGRASYLQGRKTMKKVLVLFLLVSLSGCSEDPEKICIEGTCYDVLSQASSYVSSSIDILLVVDNSGSMVGEQRQLASLSMVS